MKTEINEKESSIDIIQKRRQICLHCGIYNEDDDVCKGSLYINPDNNDVSIVPKKGYIKGCGCLLNRKIPNLSNHCPANKW